MKRSSARWSIFLSAFIIMSLFLTSVASASNDGTQGNVQSEEGDIVAVYIAKDGVLTEISKEEYAEVVREREAQDRIANSAKAKAQQLGKQQEINNLLNQNYLNNTKDENVITPMAIWSLSVYDESGYNGHVVRHSLKRRITTPIYNESANSTTYNMTSTVSETWTANLSITGSGKIDAITAGATIGAAWNRTVTGTFSISPSISSKMWGWLEFTPYHTNTWGYLNTKTYSSVPGSTVLLEDKTEWVDIYTPKELIQGGKKIPDGEYIVRESTTRPTN